MIENDDSSVMKLVINCSFCGKGRNQVKHLVEGPEVDGKNLYICNECVDVSHDLLHKEEKEKPVKKKKEKIPNPEQIKEYLDEVWYKRFSYCKCPIRGYEEEMRCV